MADKIAHQHANYPLAAYNFRVTVGNITMGFSEVSGLAQEYETLSYRDGLSFITGESVARYVKPTSQITMKKGVFAGVHTAALYNWMKSWDNRSRLLRVELCDGYDKDGNAKPVITWTVRKAIVIKLEAPSFEAGGNGVAIETLTLWASGISVDANQ